MIRNSRKIPFAMINVSECEIKDFESVLQKNKDLEKIKVAQAVKIDYFPNGHIDVHYKYNSKPVTLIIEKTTSFENLEKATPASSVGISAEKIKDVKGLMPHLSLEGQEFYGKFFADTLVKTRVTKNKKNDDESGKLQKYIECGMVQRPIRKQDTIKIEPPKKKQKSMTGILERRDIRESLPPLKAPEQVPILGPPPPPLATLFRRSIDEVDTIDYRFEESRLQSFVNWPLSYMEPAKLAAAGFYYTGEDDKVRCFECRVEVCRWVEGDDPMVDHQRWAGRCRFIRRVPCGNVPIGVDPDTIPTPQPRSHDVCGNYGLEYRSSTVSDVPQDIQLPSTARLGILGIGRPRGPAHPEYASYHARLETFESWPKSMPQTKEQLTDAGFYYTGKGDQTSCYYCGGGLKDWEPGDDPWTQHAKWFSKCYYLLTVKGQEYINNVTGQHILPPSREEALSMNLPSFIQKKMENIETAVEVKEDDAGSEPLEVKPGPSSQTSSVVGSCDSGFSSGSGSFNGSLDDLKSGESKPLDDARMCKICYNDELGVVFLPCGHIVACVKCAPGMTSCAVCREPVTMTVRAFFS